MTSEISPGNRRKASRADAPGKGRAMSAGEVPTVRTQENPAHPTVRAQKNPAHDATDLLGRSVFPLGRGRGSTQGQEFEGVCKTAPPFQNGHKNI